MKILIILLSFILIGSNVLPAFSSIDYYDTLDMMWFYKTPLVCTYEALSDKIMGDTRNAILAWEGKMKATERYPKDQAAWEIDYRMIPLDEIDTFDILKCDITISFFDRPTNPEEWLDVIGQTFYPDETNPRINIEIYYEDIEICTTKSSDANYIYTNYDLCYNERTKPTSELTPTVSHEFGHALGLGHFTLFDDERHESIMTPYEFDTPRLQIIKPVDVDALLSIYGPDGFVNEWTNPNFLWPGWMAESLFEWYHDNKILEKEYLNAMKWYHQEAKLGE